MSSISTACFDTSCFQFPRNKMTPAISQTWLNIRHPPLCIPGSVSTKINSSQRYTRPRWLFSFTQHVLYRTVTRRWPHGYFRTRRFRCGTERRTDVHRPSPHVLNCKTKRVCFFSSYASTHTTHEYNSSFLRWNKTVSQFVATIG